VKETEQLSLLSALRIKRKNLFTDEIFIKEPLSYGQWREKCGVVFLLHSEMVDYRYIYLKKIKLRHFQGSWRDTQNVCRRLGMSPITVQNLEKQYCLNDFFAGKQ